ncbi:DUF1206 domain-containing protein [Deinococcus sp. YIM 134068]|uniref:DUF1206 domain-containing protein n=1 Tax=Deinococcus lichenicola TaxID=3118910 RepID=UPI002F949212
MAELKDVGGRLRAEAAREAARAVPGIEALARFGYASKGVVYATVGGLALSVALGRGGATTDTQGALLRLQDLPLGTFLTLLLVVGLVGYALWQGLRAVLDPERQGSGANGIVKRVGYGMSAAVNVGVAIFAARLATQGSAPRNQNSEGEAARRVLDLPGGQALLTLAGLALLAVAANQLYAASGAKFMKRMAFSDLGPGPTRTLQRVGQVGVGARGLLLGLIGVFCLVGAWQGDSNPVLGTSEVLTWLRGQPAGNLLLGAVALGTLAYGVWCAVQARYRRIQVRG